MNKYSIYGAIIGDVAGSTYEVDEIDSKHNNKKISYAQRTRILSQNTPLFLKESSFTDDSILTCAIASAILTDKDYCKALKQFGQQERKNGVDKYGRSRFGPGFLLWLDSSENGNSYGNGCAMRISPVGYAFDTLEETIIEARNATTPSHNNSEAIECAMATAGAIFLARTGADKPEIQSFVASMMLCDFSKLSKEDLQRNYVFTSRAINSVPQAIFAFLTTNSFEECVRMAISFGGDTDTIATIAGSIAGAYYGVPEKIYNELQKYIPENYKNILSDFSKKYTG